MKLHAKLFWHDIVRDSPVDDTAPSEREKVQQGCEKKMIVKGGKWIETRFSSLILKTAPSVKQPLTIC